MTRKRFIKLCMSYGHQRNEAQAMAARATFPYQREYERILFIRDLRIVKSEFERFGTYSVNSVRFCNAALHMAHVINRD